MALNHDQIVEQVKTTAGVDATDADVSSVLNHLIGEMAAESEWIKAQPELGPTVAGQAAYTLPDNVVRVHKLRVDGLRYEATGTGDEWDLESGRAQRTDTTIGMFAESFSADGLTKQITLYPAPSEAGQEIEALAVLRPSAITGTTYPPFPDEFHLSLVYGTKAHFLALSEENVGTAGALRQEFEAAKSKLRRLSMVRTRSGPIRIEVVR